jgi:excisionase family DNA binding protein
MNDETITTGEVASILGLSLSTTKRRARRGELPTVGKLPGRTGSYLFSRSTIEFIAKQAA